MITDIVPTGAKVSALVQFVTTGNMGEIVLDAGELAGYIDSVTNLGDGTVQLSTPLFNGNESMSITGTNSGDDITIGQLQGQILQAISNYNAAHWWNLTQVSITVALGTLQGIPNAAGGSPVSDLSGLIGNSAKLGGVVIIGVVLLLAFAAYKDVRGAV